MITFRFPKWIKRGLIYNCDNRPFFKTHATRPIPFLINASRLRLFFSSRGSDDMPYPTFIDVDPNDPKRVLTVNESPLMALGRPGTFDDSGVTPVSILKKDNVALMYYVGWKRRRYGVSIETSIGVAELSEDGASLERAFQGPLIGQDRTHPILVAAPYVVPFGDGYRMWYCSGKEWRQMPHGPEMIYTIFEARSEDGYTWVQSANKPLIEYRFDGEVISAPWVEKINDGPYFMWYSVRGSASPLEKNYGPGLAYSCDGEIWTRCDSLVGIEKSSSGWDSEMICYPAIFNYNDKTYMFYSGNSVGMGGIGYAIADHQLSICAQ